MVYREQFGKNLRFLRKKNGWTLRQCADMIGVTAPMVLRYERGQDAPGFDTLIRIADVFDVSTDALIGRREIGTAPSSK